MIDMPTASSQHGLSDVTAERSPRSRGRIPPSRGFRTRISPSRDAFPLDLLSAVDRNVIPRLHAALQNDLRRPRHPLISGTAELGHEVADFADRMLAGDLEGACLRVDALSAAGRSLECIYLKLFAPVACHLRDLWSDDLCGLADVTFALCNLQSVLRRYAQDFYVEDAKAESAGRVLVVAPTGDGIDILTPVFGLVLMSHFFRRDGWDAVVERDFSCDSFRQTANEWFDLVEILAANDGQLDAIASGIRAIRRGSPNPALGVIVCGQIFSSRPDYVGLVGADLAATDPLSSLVQARSFQAKSFATRPTQHRRLS